MIINGCQKFNLNCTFLQRNSSMICHQLSVIDQIIPWLDKTIYNNPVINFLLCHMDYNLLSILSNVPENLYTSIHNL